MAILKSSLVIKKTLLNTILLSTILLLVSCSRGDLQGTEKSLGSGFTLYYITDTGKRIEYEGDRHPHYTAVSNTVDGYYNSPDYIFAIRKPSDNTAIGTNRSRYTKPCEYIFINKNTHEKHSLTEKPAFIEVLNKHDLQLSDLSFTFEKNDKRSCRYKENVL